MNRNTSSESTSAPPTPRCPTREIRPDADPFAPAKVELLAIPQLVNPGEVRDEDLLPSFLYLPGATDFPAGSLALPWDANARSVVGRLAQKRGVGECRAPGLVGQVVAVARRRGSHRAAAAVPRARRRAEDLAGGGQPRAIWSTCAHAWDAKMPDAPFTEQQVLVTVPASFDAVARELTLKAAEQAGYQNITLLEEPQAAFYAWIERHPDWRERVSVGDLILVVDIGGGTTDFTLIAVTEQGGELTLERVAVGEHILLGGDNIDLALAGWWRSGWREKGTSIDSLAASGAVEQLPHRQGEAARPGIEEGEAAGHDSRQGHGPGGRHDQGRRCSASDLERMLSDGFLPAVSSQDMPARQRRVGLAGDRPAVRRRCRP